MLEEVGFFLVLFVTDNPLRMIKIPKSPELWRSSLYFPVIWCVSAPHLARCEIFGKSEP